MVILGINGVDGIFHDASASLVVDSEIIASVEEERFNRRKHSNGIPFQAIEFCLRKAGLSFSDVNHIGYYLQPEVLRKTFLTDIVSAFGGDASRLAYIDQAANRIAEVEQELRKRFSFRPSTRFHYLNHHMAHAASVYYTSGFERAAILTVDGSGDRESSALFRGNPNGLEKIHEFLVYPESLGFLYTVFAAHLGLNWISGPGKLMGLAGYGRPDPQPFDDVVLLSGDSKRPVRIDLSFFEYHLGGSGLSSKGLARFGKPLAEGAPLDQSHCDLAASVQTVLERAVIHLARQVPSLLPGEESLCLSGGVALNVTTNRRIRDLGLFRRFFVNPPAYDGGTSLGCALYLDAQINRSHKYAFPVYCGPDIERDFDIEAGCRAFGDSITWERVGEAEVVSRAARALAEGKFVGWVQGRMECGPRALGNRSILGNPILPDTKDRLNAGIKKREAFRPYASSVCREESARWFDLDDSPYMLLEAKVHAEKRASIPAVVHVDGTSRPQTVTEEANPRYYRLIRAFFERTGVPMVLNTSFNQHGEPVVNRPEEAVAALLATTLDDLFIGDYHVRRNPASHHRVEWVSDDGGGVWVSREISGVFDVRQPVPHNQAIVKCQNQLIVQTAQEQWSYAAGFRFQPSVLAAGGQPEALLIRVQLQVERGSVGAMFVLDDLQTVVGSAGQCSAGDPQNTVDLVLEPIPSAGWLILRNNAPQGVRSECSVKSIRTFRSKRGVPDLG